MGSSMTLQEIKNIHHKEIKRFCLYMTETTKFRPRHQAVKLKTGHSSVDLENRNFVNTVGYASSEEQHNVFELGAFSSCQSETEEEKKS